MGRPKRYDRVEVADRAMQLFWERGFHATSTRDLSQAMSLNPNSMYAEFGSKEGLFQAAIGRYEDTVVGGHFGPLTTPTASLEEIRDVLGFFGDSADREGSYRGCLLCNASTELAPTVDASRASMARYVQYLTDAFSNALGNAATQGRLVDAAPIEELARFFATVLMGTFVLLRAQVDGAVPQAAAAQALSRLDEVTRRP